MESPAGRYSLTLHKGDIEKVSPETYQKFQEAVRAMVRESGAETIEISPRATADRVLFIEKDHAP